MIDGVVMLLGLVAAIVIVVATADAARAVLCMPARVCAWAWNRYAYFISFCYLVDLTTLASQPASQLSPSANWAEITLFSNAIKFRE